MTHSKGAPAPLSPSEEHLAAQRILPVTEEELQRMILDIHDGPVQKLFAALTQLNLLQAQMTRSSAGAAEWLADIRRISRVIQESQAEIRSILGARRPPEFARRELRQMLEGLLLQNAELTGMQVALEVEGEIPCAPLPVKIALYRITQEALANVYRHAGVMQAVVHLSTRRGKICLEVRDSGCGFAPPALAGPHATERAEHIGLRGMRERMSLVGGTFQVESSPGSGTLIRVEVPANET